MFFKSFFSNKETITFDENGYTNKSGYSDYKAYRYQGHELNSFVWVNKDKQTIRISSLIHLNFNRLDTSWTSQLVYFKIYDWPEVESKQKQMVRKLLFSTPEGERMDANFKEIVTNEQRDLIVQFLGNLHFQH